MDIISFLGLFAVCLTILMLFAGLTRMYSMSERLATLAVPIMLVLTAWISRMIYKMMIQSAMGDGGGNPFEGM
jgi:hypothetical protein